MQNMDDQPRHPGGPDRAVGHRSASSHRLGAVIVIGLASLGALVDLIINFVSVTWHLMSIEPTAFDFYLIWVTNGLVAYATASLVIYTTAITSIAFAKRHLGYGLLALGTLVLVSGALANGTRLYPTPTEHTQLLALAAEAGAHSPSSKDSLIDGVPQASISWVTARTPARACTALHDALAHWPDTSRIDHLVTGAPNGSYHGVACSWTALHQEWPVTVIVSNLPAPTTRIVATISPPGTG